MAPKQHNSREENETIKEGETPEDWKSKLAKNRQKDKDALTPAASPRRARTGHLVASRRPIPFIFIEC